MSPSSPKTYRPEIDDPPEPFDVEQHQIDVFRSSKRGNELWEFLENNKFEFIRAARQKARITCRELGAALGLKIERFNVGLISKMASLPNVKMYRTPVAPYKYKFIFDGGDGLLTPA